MAIEDSYARCVMEHGMSPPLTSSETLHWDGIGTPSRCWGPTENAAPVLPALLHPLSAPAGAMYQMLASSSAAIDWVREATSVTFYLAPVLLLEMATDNAAAVLASVGHGLQSCLVIGHSLWPSEVTGHMECTDLACLHEAITHDLAQLDGVTWITPCTAMKTGEHS